MELCSVRALLWGEELCFAWSVPALACVLFCSTAAAHCESFGLSAAAGSQALVQAESVNPTRIRTKTNRSAEVKIRGVISAAAWTCRDVPLIRLCGGVVGKPPPQVLVK